MLKIILRNAVSNWMGFAVSVVVTFFLTPFILHSLGDVRYGIWALVIGFTGYYGLLDLGFRSGITQYMTRHLATRDFDQMNRTASTAFVGLMGCGTVIAVIAVCLAGVAPYVFTIPTDAAHETRWSIIIIGISTGVQFGFFPFSSVYIATQRYDIANVVGIAVRLLSAGAIYIALALGCRLVGLAVVTVATELLGYVIRWRLAYRILPQLVVSARLASWECLWPIASFGFWSVLLHGAAQLKAHANTLLIGILLPIAAIAPYSLASGLVGYFDRLFTPLGVVLYPAMTHLDAQGMTSELKQLYLRGSRILLALGMIAAPLGAVWAEDFFRLWVGERFVKGDDHVSVAVLFHILIVGLAFIPGQRVGEQVFFATRRMRLIAFLFTAEATIGLLISLCLIVPFGLIGVAFGLAVPALIYQAAVQPILLCRILGVPIRQYVRELLFWPVLVACVSVLLFTRLRTVLPPVNGWSTLVFHGSLAALIGASIFVLIGLSRSDRQVIALKLSRSFAARWGRNATPGVLQQDLPSSDGERSL